MARDDFRLKLFFLRVSHALLHVHTNLLLVAARAHLVGRLDPKLDRKNRKMTINSIQLEDENLENGTFMSELAKSFQRFLEFHDAFQFRIKKD